MFMHASFPSSAEYHSAMNSQVFSKTIRSTLLFFVAAIAFALAVAPQPAYAADIYIHDGSFKISDLVAERGLAAGDSLKIGEATTLIIDQDFALGKIYATATSDGLTIQGTSTLTVENGVYLGTRKFTMNSGTLKITGPWAANPSAGITASETIVNGGTTNIKAKRTDGGTYADAAGIYGAGLTFYQSAGSLTMSVNNAGQDSYGIRGAAYVDISDGTVEITGKHNGIKVYNSSENEQHENYIRADAKVTVTGNHEAGIYGIRDGGWIIEGTAELSSSGGNQWQGISTYGHLNVAGTPRVTLESSGSGVAVYAEKKIIIGELLEISDPAGGKLDTEQKIGQRARHACEAWYMEV